MADTKEQMQEPEKVLYKGACHCHNVKFTVTLPPLETKTVIDCNCTNCRIHGLNVTHCQRKDVQITRGEEFLSKPYAYIAKSVGYRFCTNCGTGLFFDTLDPSDVESFVAVNTRVLEGVDVDKLSLTFYNGLSKNLDLVPKREW